MTVNDTDIAAALAHDPLAAAEEITGKSYKDSKGTMSLGMLMALESNIRKQALLEESNDTHYNTSWDDFLMYLELEGFTVEYTEEFDGTYGKEVFLLAHSPRGLVRAESYTWSGRPRKVNSATLYFNLHITDADAPWLSCSGHFHLESHDAGKRVWVGHADIREGFRHFLRTAEAQGEFLSPWVETPCLWLLTYADTKDDYQALAWPQRHDYTASLNQRRLTAIPNAETSLGIQL